MKFYKNLAFITALLVDARPQAAMADNRVNSLSNKHKYDFDYFKMLEWERPLAPSYKKGKMVNKWYFYDPSGNLKEIRYFSPSF